MRVGGELGGGIATVLQNFTLNLIIHIFWGQDGWIKQYVIVWSCSNNLIWQILLKENGRLLRDDSRLKFGYFFEKSPSGRGVTFDPKNYIADFCLLNMVHFGRKF